jgi:hypothetical protein
MMKYRSAKAKRGELTSKVAEMPENIRARLGNAAAILNLVSESHRELEKQRVQIQSDPHLTSAGRRAKVAEKREAYLAPLRGKISRALGMIELEIAGIEEAVTRKLDADPFGKIELPANASSTDKLLAMNIREQHAQRLAMARREVIADIDRALAADTTGEAIGKLTESMLGFESVEAHAFRVAVGERVQRNGTGGQRAIVPVLLEADRERRIAKLDEHVLEILDHASSLATAHKMAEIAVASLDAEDGAGSARGAALGLQSLGLDWTDA